MSEAQRSTRAGRFVKQLAGYRSFIPTPLPPDPPLLLDRKFIFWLSNAEQALGRLDGASAMLPNPDLFVAMYVRREAVLSSRIEGTESSLEDVLQYQIDAKGKSLPKDVGEVVNYVKAMNHGLERLSKLPLCNRLIREIHGVLLEGVRGGERTPGEFRRSQNWIGKEGSTIETASFVPPAVHDMNDALGEFEKFLNDRSLFPPLVHCGLAHAQFETIHPFLDGNGRVGRLLIALLLCERGVLRRPLLYLSVYFKRNRTEYYKRLTAIRTAGDWEGWIVFFLRGVASVSREATALATRILALREADRPRVDDSRFLDILFMQPIVTVPYIAERLSCTHRTASLYLRKLLSFGLLSETTGYKRNRRFRYDAYLALFESEDAIEEDEDPSDPDGLPRDW